MKKITYKYFNEVTYYEKLSNGMKIYIIPNKKFKTNFCFNIVDFGSFNSYDYLDNRQIPLGLAHFLEHRIFNYKDIDYLKVFADMGVNVNAYTTYTYTTYTFDTTKSILKPLKALLDMCLHCEMSKDSFEKEKAIIVNEMYMRQDSEKYRHFANIRKDLYHFNLLKEEVVGTESSVNNTELIDLYNVHDYFYKPDHMKLVILGNVDVEKTITFIKDYFKLNKFTKSKLVYRLKNDIEPNEVVKDYDEDTTKNKDFVWVSFKLPIDPSWSDAKINKLSYVASIYSHLLFGANSKFYKERKGIFYDFGFGLSSAIAKQFGFIMIKVSYVEFEKCIEKIKEIINNSLDIIDYKLIKAYRNSHVGNIFNSLNSTSEIAEIYVENIADNIDVFKDINQLLTINKKDIIEFDAIMKKASMSILNCKEER